MSVFRQLIISKSSIVITIVSDLSNVETGDYSFNNLTLKNVIDETYSINVDEKNYDEPTETLTI